MSVKIYHGMRVDCEDDLLSIKAKSDEIKVAIHKVRKKWWYRICPTKDARQAAWLMTLHGGVNRYDVIEELGFGLDLVWFPYTATQQLLIPFSGMINEYAKTIVRLPGVESWGYWTNTDKPSNVTVAEWDHRGEAWMRALPGAGIPSECGFSIRAIPPGTPFPFEYERKRKRVSQ